MKFYTSVLPYKGKLLVRGVNHDGSHKKFRVNYKPSLFVPSQKETGYKTLDDRDVGKFLRVFTDLEINEIDNIKNNNINELKILLANKATSMLHGEKAARNAEQAAKEAFSGNSLGANLPSVKIELKNINNQLNIVDLIILSKLENSKSEIRRLFKGKAIKINDALISDEKLIIKKELFTKNYLKLSIGKKRHIKIELV